MSASACSSVDTRPPTALLDGQITGRPHAVSYIRQRPPAGKKTDEHAWAL